MVKRIIASVLLGGSLVSGASHAVDCSGLPAWNSTDAYNGGQEVQHNSNAYRANWWTQNQNPETHSGQWQEWTLLGACNGGGSNQPPSADANGPYSGQVGNAIAFSSAGSTDPDGTITAYSWNFGDGNTSNSANPSHTYTTAGSYTATLTVTDNGGGVDTASAAVTVSGGSGGSCPGLPTYSAGTSYTAGQHVVNFVQASGQNVEFVCNVPGWCSSSAAWAYEPGNGAHWEDAWSEVGPCGGSSNQPPTAQVNGPYSGNVGEAIAFSSFGSDDPDGSIATYSWNFGDGSTSNAANPNHSYANAGTYNVSLTVTDNEGSSGSASTTATITGPGGNEAPTAEANGPYSGTVGAAISFSSGGSNDTDGSITAYSWDFGDGNTSSGANPSHTYNTAGNYTVTLTVTDNEGATGSDTTSANVSNVPGGGGKKIIGYFTQWGIYQRGYLVKNIVTSGSADKLTHIVYAFGNVSSDGRCTANDDPFADYQKAFTAAESVDGVADVWDQPLKGNFNQLRKLKQMYPNIKLLWSFGGWTYSGNFGAAAANPTAFAESCYNLVHDPRWDGLFDGIDVDWEYPNECGLSCDSSGFEAYGNLMAALRARFGNELVTSAITASETKLNAANYGTAAQYVDFYMLMTYDFFGAWDRTGPTAPHSALTSFPSIPIPEFYSDNAVQVLKSKGVPADKILLGIGFYGRGWSGVSQSAPGGSATGPGPGTYEQGIEDYKVLKGTCPATGTVGGTAYAHCGNQWWSYDTPATINGKMNYLKSQGLGGAFFWEFNGDTTNGELINAISNGLN